LTLAASAPTFFWWPRIGAGIRRIGALTAQTIAATQAAPATRDGGDDALLDLILASLDDDKAEDVVRVDLRGKSAVADHMVICSGRSSRQVTAICEKLADRLKERLGRTARMEGKDQGDWVLVDAGDVIVHVFRPEVREFYQLEKMWLDPGQSPAPAAGREEAAARRN
jgi:ribosome-associated protein